MEKKDITEQTLNQLLVKHFKNIMEIDLNL